MKKVQDEYNKLISSKDDAVEDKKPNGGKDTDPSVEDENAPILGSENYKKFGLYGNGAFWRERTFAEQKVNMEALRDKMDILEQEMARELPKVLAPEITNILNDVRLAMQIGDPNRVNDIIARYKDDLRQYVMKKLRDAFEVGKLSASNEMDIAAPRNDVDVINAIKVRSDTIADSITNDIETRARLTTLDMINNKVPIDDGLAALERQLMAQLGLTINNTASIITGGGINQGRQSVFDKNMDKIYAMQRSEILDNRICNYCVSMDGRVVEKEDPLVKYGTFHFQCRGIWVEILNEEEELPDITGVPEELRKSAGVGVGDFNQIKEPMPLASSLAEEFLDESD